MTKRLLIQISFLLIFFVSPPSFSQENSVNTNPIHVAASYTFDNLNNFYGGIKKGYGYLGLVNLSLSINTKDAKLWKGGQFYICGANTHGASPSQELIGDVQVVSNIEAGEHTYMQELWYSQTLGPWQFVAGLQNMNTEFANSEHGVLFLNSSFGIHPSISGNIPAPIFPLTTLGFTAKWKVSEKIGWNIALYDGVPTEFDNNPYNLKWQLNNSSLLVSEIQYSLFIDQLKGTYKAGVYRHNYSATETDSANLASLSHYGFYATADQMIWQKAADKKGIGLFGQIGYNPEKNNQNFFYAGMGVNYYGLFSKKRNDIAGLAVAHDSVKDMGNETSIELTYLTNVTDKICIQPDIQYIINPLGTTMKLNNCLEGTLRIKIIF